MSRRVVLLLLVALVPVLGAFGIVVLDERDQAFRTAFGDPDFKWFGLFQNPSVMNEPGIYLDVPMVHSLYVFDRRRMDYDARSFDVQTSENQLISVDYYTIWRIEDPRKVFEAFITTEGALQRLDAAARSNVREIINQHTLRQLLSEQREEMTREMVEKSNSELRPDGIEIVDLRIRRIDYPESNLAQIYNRMRTERQRFALKYRAEGEEQARTIRSLADRDAEVIAAEAEGHAARLQGEGDARAIRIYADAYSQDLEFYKFSRSLDAYRKALDDQTTLILSHDAPFLKYLFGDGALTPVGAEGPTTP